MEGSMDYVAKKLGHKEEFTAEAYFCRAHAKGTVTLQAVHQGQWRKVLGFWKQDGTKYETIDEFDMEAGETITKLCSRDTPVRLTTVGQISTFSIDPDPDYSKPIQIKREASYDVLGTCVIDGVKDTIIGPFHLPGLRGGAIGIEIAQATRGGDGFMQVFLETSPDGINWEILEQGGLSKGIMEIHQNTIKSGDYHGDEWYLVNHGEYIRINCQAHNITAQGFRGNVTVETKR